VRSCTCQYTVRGFTCWITVSWCGETAVHHKIKVERGITSLHICLHSHSLLKLHIIYQHGEPKRAWAELLKERKSKRDAVWIAALQHLISWICVFSAFVQREASTSPPSVGNHQLRPEVQNRCSGLARINDKH